MTMLDTATPVVERSRNRLTLFVIYGILIFAAFLSLIPFYWMLISSFKPLNDILTIPVWIIPTHPTIDNYVLLLAQTGFARSVLNTLFVAIVNVVVQTMLCSLAGFSFPKKPFKFRKLLFSPGLGPGLIPAGFPLFPNIHHLG